MSSLTSRSRTGRADWMTSTVPFLRVGHRGAGILEPMNTLRSFRRALEFGVDMIEVDLRLSSDGELVLAHDDDIHDREGRRMQVADHALAELQALDLGEGERIPTLKAAIETCKGRCAMMLDLKGEGFEGKLVHLLHEMGYANVIIPGGSALSRRLIRELNPMLPISLSLGGEWKDRVDDAFIRSIDTDAVTWHYTLLDEGRIERLHEKGLKVFAWTVDTEAEMKRLAACKVDGIISNRPELLMAL